MIVPTVNRIIIIMLQSVPRCRPKYQLSVVPSNIITPTNDNRIRQRIEKTPSDR